MSKSDKFGKTHIRIFDSTGENILATNVNANAFEFSHAVLDLIEKFDKKHSFGSKDVVDGYNLST